MAGREMIAHANMQDVAPLPHLRHVSPKWRVFISKVGGTAEGLQWASTVSQWAQNEMARAVAVEAQVQMFEQAYGSKDPERTAYLRSLSAKYRLRAAALEQEAAALRTTHANAEPFTGDASACGTYRRRLEHTGV